MGCGIVAPRKPARTRVFALICKLHGRYSQNVCSGLNRGLRFHLRFVFAQADNHYISRQSTTRNPTEPVAASAHSELPNDERLGNIIRVLADNPTLVISGTKLAEEIGSTRSDVWRLIEQLRSLGVEITGHAATGYQLIKVPDLPLPEVLDSLLKGTIFAKKVHHYFRIGSTNFEAMQAASSGAPEGSV